MWREPSATSRVSRDSKGWAASDCSTRGGCGQSRPTTAIACQNHLVNKRVAAIVEQSWHKVPGGTAASTVRSLAAVAKRDEWDIVGVSATHLHGPDPLVVPTVDVERIWMNRIAMYESWHRLRRPAIQRTTGPVDIIHATGGVVPPSGGAPIVVTIHDLAFMHRPGHFTRHGVSFMTRSFELTRRDARIVLVPSQTTADDCVQHGIVPARIRVARWGVEPVSVSDEDRVEVAARHHLPSSFVLWVGTAEPRKNLRGLLAALRSTVHDVPLVLVGPEGWGVDIDDMIAATSRLVLRLGKVSQSDLMVLYNLADVFVYPSLLEGFGMPVLEAMAQLTPVITSSGTATEEVAGGAAELVDPTDLEALAAAIDNVLDDGDRRRELVEAGRVRAADMTWDATADAIIAAYNEASA